MNSIELQIWIAAFTANQPRDTTTYSALSGRNHGTTTAAYWAACAVFALRSAGEPTEAQCADLIEEVRALSARSKSGAAA